MIWNGNQNVLDLSDPDLGCLTGSGLFTCVRKNWYLVAKKTEKEVPDLALNRIAFIQGDFLFTTGSLPVPRRYICLALGVADFFR